MLVYVATTNQGKLLELRELTAGSSLHLMVDDSYVAATEGESSYAENAAIKAHALRNSLLERGITAAVIADDSGLEIDALDGRPGVLSARYGGDLTWEERRRYILGEMADQANRKARFVCVLHFIDELNNEIVSHAYVDGEITMEERGERGFSYDPIFWYPPLERTFAELRVREKNAVSHRAIAVGKLLVDLGASADGEENEDHSQGLRTGNEQAESVT